MVASPSTLAPTAGGLFAVSALSTALSFVAGIKQAKDTNEYLAALQAAQEKAAAQRTAAEVEGITARSVQIRMAAANRADEISRMARTGLASEQVASAAAGVIGATGGEVELDFRARVSEAVAIETMNLSAEEDQIQRMLDAVPINQASAVEAQTGATGPSVGEAGLNLLASYMSIQAQFG